MRNAPNALPTATPAIAPGSRPDRSASIATFDGNGAIVLRGLDVSLCIEDDGSEVMVALDVLVVAEVVSVTEDVVADLERMFEMVSVAAASELSAVCLMLQRAKVVDALYPFHGQHDFSKPASEDLLHAPLAHVVYCGQHARSTPAASSVQSTALG